jgi:hypothetical protein
MKDLRCSAILASGDSTVL